MSRRFYDLQYLFLGNFHPDWRTDGATRRDVVERFVRTDQPQQIEGAVRDLRELLAEPMSEQHLHDLVIREYSLFYDPWFDEIGMHEWLAGLLRQLEEALKTVGPGDQ